jgi:hypothetical protein
MDIRLVLFFLFEKYVMKEIASVYERYNDCLVNAGIFPNLKYVAPKVPHDDPVKDKKADAEGDDFVPTDVGEVNIPVAATMDAGGQYVSVSEEIFNSICSLLTIRRKNDPLYYQHPEIHPDAPQVDMTTRPALVAVIGDIQQSVSNSYSPVSQLVADANHASLVDTTLLQQIQNRPSEEQNQIFDDVERRSIPSADLDTIEFVGILFEYVLDDKQLPNLVKALISHLHTPYLKLAVIDSGFLKDDQHIARQLLDLMLEAGRNWVDEAHLLHGAYYPMERQVERILHEFKEDTALFGELLEDLKKDINTLEQKAAANEERSRESERGRDKLEAARKRATRVINKHVGEKELPSQMHDFLFKVWMDRMTLLLLRNPNAEETTTWKNTLIIIDALLWALGARDDEVKQQKLRDIYPALRTRIEKYLEKISDYYEPEAQAMFDLLLEYQMDGELAPEEVRSEEVVLKPDAGKEETDSNDSYEIELKGIAQDIDRVDDKIEEEEEIDLTIEEELIAKRLSMSEFGTWFEFDNESADEEPMRAKLSWYSPLTKRYMFVDRNGAQVAVRPLQTLVKELSGGSARILEPPTYSLLDQAISSIKEMLERAVGAVKPVTP